MIVCAANFFSFVFEVRSLNYAVIMQKSHAVCPLILDIVDAFSIFHGQAKKRASQSGSLRHFMNSPQHVVSSALQKHKHKDS